MREVPRPEGGDGTEELRAAVAAVEARATTTADLPPLAPEAHDAVAAALRLLRYRARSEHELRERLKGKNFAAPSVDEAVARIRAWGLLDDADFASEWVRGRRRRRGRSRSALVRELREKGVAETHIAGAVAGIDDADENIQAVALVRARLARRPVAPGAVADIEGERRRLVAFLGRRGYPTGLALAVVNAELDSADA